MNNERKNPKPFLHKYSKIAYQFSQKTGYQFLELCIIRF